MATIQRSPDPFFYSGGKTGILLIHGFTGTPSELRPMGEYFRNKGYTVYAPLLAGHGLSPEELRKTTWRNWWQSTINAYQRMQAETNEIFPIGLSMGGCLALYLAAHYPVNGVVSMCAPVWVRDKRAHWAKWVHYFIPYKLKKSRKSEEIKAHMVVCDRLPLRSVANLNVLIRKVSEALPRVNTSSLIIQACNDETIMPESADFIYAKISSQDKHLSWYKKSSHNITLDRERQQLFMEIEHFIEKNREKR